MAKEALQHLWAENTGTPLFGDRDMRIASTVSEPQCKYALLFFALLANMAPQWFAAEGAVLVAKVFSLLAILMERRICQEPETAPLPVLCTKGGRHRRADALNIVCALTTAREVGGHTPTVKRMQRNTLSLDVNKELTNTRCRAHMDKMKAVFKGAGQWCITWDPSTHGAEMNVLLAYSRDINSSAIGPIMQIDKPPRQALHHEVLLEHIAAGHKLERRLVRRAALR